MQPTQPKRILSGCTEGNFVGREREISRITRHAGSSARNSGLVLAAPPGAGTTELLTQVFDRLFLSQTEIIPFYFAIRSTDRTAVSAARRFLDEFITQTVAFRRKDAGIIAASPGLNEVAELAVPEDGHWIDRLVDFIQRDADIEDDHTVVRGCLAGPLRAAAAGARPFVMIDDVHAAAQLQGGFLDELADIFSRARAPFLLAGRRRFEFPVEGIRLNLKPLTFGEAGLLTERTAADYEIEISEQARDLVAVQFDGNPGLINAFLTSAYFGEPVESFQKVEQIYCDGLFGGTIGRRFDEMFRSCCSTREIENAVLSMLFVTDATPEAWLSPDAWERQLGEDGTDETLELLHLHEIIRVNAGRIEVAHENLTLSDYIDMRFRLGIAAENRALVYGDSLAKFITRAPELMEKHYRRASAIGLRSMLSSFAGQEVPLALIDYARFSEDLKGLPKDEIIAGLKDYSDTAILPRVFFVADTVSFYRPIEKFVERERSSTARAFETNSNDEVVWIAAEVESKMEAPRETAEFWCDRLEMAAARCDFKNYRLWLVAPEGFSAEALEVLAERNSFGSSRVQFELLKQFLSGKETRSASIQREFEIVLPMDDDSELIAAHALEEIARRHNFDQRSINQIKTALVEASINASEHSLSPDGKIYQKIIVGDDRIVISISNRGLRLAEREMPAAEQNEGRRGWGLNLMRRLMDDVKIEKVDDGTRISMTKFIKAA